MSDVSETPEPPPAEDAQPTKHPHDLVMGGAMAFLLLITTCCFCGGVAGGFALNHRHSHPRNAEQLPAEPARPPRQTYVQYVINRRRRRRDSSQWQVTEVAFPEHASVAPQFHSAERMPGSMAGRSAYDLRNHAPGIRVASDRSGAWAQG